MSRTKILCAGVALIAFSTAVSAQNYVTTVQPVPELHELDNVVRAQFIKPGDVSPEEYAKLLEEAEKVKAFQGGQTYSPLSSSSTYSTYTAPVTTYGATTYVAPATTYGTSTEYVYDGRPSVGSTVGSGVSTASTNSSGYQIELFDTPIAAPVTQVATITGSVMGRHTVAKGDTLYNISKRYKVSLSDIRESNQLSGNTISIGQVINVPTARRSVTENVYRGAPTTLVRNVEPIPNRGVYAVLPGDTLYSIARRACVGVTDITSSNGIASSATINPGQRLTLPSGHCLQ